VVERIKHSKPFTYRDILLFMSTPTQSNLDTGIIKVYEYNKYKVWKAIPSLLKYPPVDKITRERPEPRDFAIAMGIEDDETLELVEIPTQKAFAQRFGLSEDTLVDWNKTVGLQSSMEQVRNWATHLTKNVVLALYNNAIRKGNMLEVKLWLQVVEGWEEKQKVEHEYLGVASVQYEIVKVEKPIEENATAN
jgi:hypothetical protein